MNEPWAWEVVGWSFILALAFCYLFFNIILCICWYKQRGKKHDFDLEKTNIIYSATTGNQFIEYHCKKCPKTLTGLSLEDMKHLPDFQKYGCTEINLKNKTFLYCPYIPINFKETFLQKIKRKLSSFMRNKFVKKVPWVGQNIWSQELENELVKIIIESVKGEMDRRNAFQFMHPDLSEEEVQKHLDWLDKKQTGV